MNRIQSIELMNRLGREKEPFLFILDYDWKEPVVMPLKTAEENRIFYSIPGFTNWEGMIPELKNLEWKAFPVDFQEYERVFNLILGELKAGNSYLANLTFSSAVQTNRTLLELFQLSRAPYRLYFQDAWVVFSPEPFVRIKDNTIRAFPMKGTKKDTDKNSLLELMEDEKELAEHVTIVDLIRNDLSMAAKNVRVEKFRYAESIFTNRGNIIQTSSEIAGKIEENWNEEIGYILEKLLPAGSVTGAPKAKTVEILSAAENYRRGYYTGVFGIFDGNRLDSAVMIRFLEKKDGKFYYKSGGGITVYSDARREYEEMQDKIYAPVG